MSEQKYKSDNKQLSFTERMKLASEEKTVIQSEYESRKKEEAEELLDTVEDFVNTICNKETLTNKFIESVHKNNRRKVIELYTFNHLPELGNVYNKEIKSVRSDKKYSTSYILTGGYQKLTKKYFPDRHKSMIELINDKLNVEEFNNGIDVETNEKLIPCVFTKKKSGSKFKNGIYISRDGINYNIPIQKELNR